MQPAERNFAEPHSPNAERRRETWLDIVKGIGIILVVLGHTQTDLSFRYMLYWFHMPLFFAISGYLFRPVADWQSFGSFVKKRALQLLLPYAAALVLLTIIQCLVNRSLFIDWRSVGLGGKFLYGDGVALWFLTCMFMTQVLFAVVMLLFRGWPWRVLAIAGLFILAHVEAILWPSASLPIPWSLDTSLIAVGYFGFGYVARPLLSFNFRHASLVALAAIIAAALLIIGGRLEIIDYYLEMMHLAYRQPIYDLIIPPTFIVAMCGIGHLFARVRGAGVLATIGMATLPIMCLHLLANRLIYAVMGKPCGLLLFVVVGVGVPLVVTRLIFERFAVTRALFLGISGRAGR
jgi:fucose 4-O-acetylase-like acetyltransferase